ncbi:MAG: endopeptidase La, partial [Clostridia bacterium]|nr:endopeptidase La [Clostridia bacterium]
VINLPWDKETKDKLDLKHARKVLDADHYGLDAVKDRIIELLAVRRLNPDIKGQIICLAGPPGVGKTSIAKSLADAMGRSYARVSLGGIHDEAEIRGHRRTYIGSMPGRVMAAIADAGTRNPLILFDEIDKLAADIKGDPASAMLEVLDPEQNKAFVDHFIEIPFDLSNVLFITTANDKGNIPTPLLDRMEVIDLYSYTAEEKFHIAKRHLVPKALARHGIDKKQLKISDSAINELISSYTREAGVRNLEREINNICRKTALEIVSKKGYSTTVYAKDLKDLLGAPKYKEKVKLRDEVGVVNGLAWTAVGGEMLKVETAVMPGKGNVELTGSLGDVMKESAKAAVSFLRANTKKYGIAPDFYKENDIHIHVPEGAVPKDGPSAGVTMATSLLSALTGRKVNGHVAMTGEISLTGNVMPIGGLREKTMAAYKAGIKTVVIPKENMPDLDDVVDVVKKNIEFVPAAKLDDVFKVALL